MSSHSRKILNEKSWSGRNRTNKISQDPYQKRPSRNIDDITTNEKECLSIENESMNESDETMDESVLNNNIDQINQNKASDNNSTFSCDSDEIVYEDNVSDDYDIVSISGNEIMDYENDEINFDNLLPIQNILLHQYSSLSQYEVCSLLLAFKNRYTLTDRCFIVLLKLIKTFLPFDNNLPTTMERINKITSVARSKIELKKYCPNNDCQAIVQEATCVENACKNFNRIIQPDLFHYVSIKQQLVTFIQRYHKDISKYLGGNKTFLDIVETSHYMKSNSDNTNMINLIIYTDGIKLNNNDKECWPVFLSICELPLSLRDSKYNKIIAGK
jgi:hypothetical protein